ncbi:MAG: transcriptional repressor [Alicyclobacillus sp.]|nr:transcriptional repressor [Alicyclobacillus sp.]
MAGHSDVSNAMNMGRIRELLNGQHFRLTNERERLLTLFAAAPYLLTPSELHELANQQGLHVGLTTVYRLLEVLTKIGVSSAFLVDGKVYYAYCGLKHHHHFVCLRCHRVVDVEGQCPTFAVPPEFDVQDHRSDVFGTCPDCREAN